MPKSYGVLHQKKRYSFTEGHADFSIYVATKALQTGCPDASKARKNMKWNLSCEKADNISF